MGFLLFGMGILLEVILLVPVLWIGKLIAGHRSLRLRAINRRLFGVWLWFLNMGGLLKELPTKGKPHVGPCVVVCNHPGLFDVLFLIKELPDLAVMVKKALIDKLPLAPILKFSGYVVSQGGRCYDTMEPLLEALNTIDQGHKFQLFPEGTRSPCGGIRPFRVGAFQIARLAGVPVQPVFIHNHPPFMPHGDKWYYPDREPSYVQLEFWEPLSPPVKGGEKEMAHALEERFRNCAEKSRTNWQTKQEASPSDLLLGLGE